jgi:hypothetical protein
VPFGGSQAYQKAWPVTTSTRRIGGAGGGGVARGSGGAFNTSSLPSSYTMRATFARGMVSEP